MVVELPLEGDSRKPDPEEPWRYQCPDCRKQVRGDNSMNNYYCQYCRESFEKNELFDQKHGNVLGS